MSARPDRGRAETAAIEIPAGSRPSPQAERASFEDRHQQTRIDMIVRINQKTAGVDCDEQGWRVFVGTLRHVVDL